MLWTELTFGVEVEVMAPADRYVGLGDALEQAGVAVSRHAGMHQTVSGWKIVSDGSLRPTSGFVGLEIVSPILRGTDGLEQVRKVTAVLNAQGCKVNASCGLHVHIGAGSVSPAQIKNLCAVFLKNEHHFDSIVPASRRESRNQYCKSNRAYCFGSADNAGVIARLANVRTVRALQDAVNGGVNGPAGRVGFYGAHRYFKLNLQSLTTHGTVEFRQHSGTTDGEEIVQWVRLVAGMAAYAFSLRTVKGTAVPSFSRFLAKTDQAGETYFRARYRALNNGAEAPVDEELRA